MKKLFLMAALLVSICPLIGRAQATIGYHRVSQIIARGNTGVAAQVVPYAKINVTNTATGVAATIYSDPLLTAPISPPTITADGSGNYSYYLALNYCVTESISSPGQGFQPIANICQFNEGSSTLNSLTFNNSGSGAASGVSFNGSTPYTISYNTIGAQPAGNYITALTGDVVASGAGSVTATVKGIDTVPLCTGFTPTNGQAIEYTTGGSPNPCYNAVTPASGTITGSLTSGYLIKATGATTIADATADYSITTSNTYTFPQALKDNTSLTAPVTNGHQTIGPATGNDSAIINAAITAAGFNGTVDLTPGQIYTSATAQLLFNQGWQVFNFNGSCIEVTFNTAASVLITGSSVTMNDPCFIPGAAIPYAMINDSGWRFTTYRGGVAQLQYHYPSNGYYWYWNFEYAGDEVAGMYDWNEQSSYGVVGSTTVAGSQSTLRCDSTFCGAAVYNPVCSGCSAILTMHNVALTMGCSGNSIDWEGDNALNATGLTIQSYNEYGIKINNGNTGAGLNSIVGLYNSPTPCSGSSASYTTGNPLVNNIPMATPITLGGSTFLAVTSARIGFALSGYNTVATCTGTCTTNYGYYVVIHNGGSSTSVTPPIAIGQTGNSADSAFTSTSVLVTNPTSPGTGDTCDFLRVNQTASLSGPIYGNATAWALPSEQGVACGPGAGTYISFTDTTANASLTSYIWATAPITNPYAPWLGQYGWANAVIITDGNAISGHSTYTGPCPIAGAWIDPSYAGSNYGNKNVNCTDNVNEAYGSSYQTSTPGIETKPFGGFNNQTGVISAFITPLWSHSMGSGGGYKGLYNLGVNGSTYAWSAGPLDAITLIDSNPFKTLATQGNRPSWDIGDTAISLDYPGAYGLGFRDANHICNYIDTIPDYAQYYECVLATGRFEYAPTTIYNALNVSQITTTPSIGTIVGYTSGGSLASATYYYVIQGVQVGGEHSANSSEKNVATGSCTSGNNCHVAFIVSGIGNYPAFNVYRSTSTGTEVGPCNGTVNNTPVPAYVTTFVDLGSVACGATSPTNSNTMPSASATVGGPITSTSSSAAVGYGTGTGAGCAITQVTSRTTGVTCTGNTGAITLYTAAGSATAATFTVTDTSVAATDTVQCSQKSGTNLYQCFATAIASGSFNVTFFTTGGTSSDAPVFNFTVMKGSAN